MYPEIVVPLDGSPLGERALPHALHLAKTSQPPGRIHLLQVVSRYPELEAAHLGDMGMNPTVAEMNAQQARAMMDSYLKATASYLERTAGPLRGQDIRVQTAVLEGAAPDGIVQYAQQHGASVIVMSTRGRSGPKRFFLGSIADQVIRLSTVPVLVVPPKVDSPA